MISPSPAFKKQKIGGRFRSADFSVSAYSFTKTIFPESERAAENAYPFQQKASSSSGASHRFWAMARTIRPRAILASVARVFRAPFRRTRKSHRMNRSSFFKKGETARELSLIHILIKRTPLSQYANIRKSGLNAITFFEGDALAWTRLTSGHDELIVATRNGLAIRFNEEDARSVGRTSHGVKAITLAEGDEVVGGGRIRPGATLCTVTENGRGPVSYTHLLKLRTRKRRMRPSPS